MRRGGRGGFTLAEALVTLGLVAVVLAVVGDLCREYADTIRWAAGKDAALMGPHDVVERVRCEMVGATAVISPAPGQAAPSSQVIFRRVDPTCESRIPEVLPSPLPSNWNPQGGEYLSRIRYAIEDGHLQREVTFPDGTAVVEWAAADVAGFSVRCLDETAWEIRASFAEERLVHTVSTVARLRTGQ